MLKIWPMLKSILWKELRELLPLIAIALAVECYCFAYLMHPVGFPERPDPRVVFPILYMLGVLFPIGFGLWQVAREAFGSHYQFLLHRPIERSAIFATKLIFGTAACFLIIDVPITCFGAFGDWQLQQTYHQQTDLFSSYTWPLCVEMLLLYLAAFLSALRPGRWYGSQFLPLLAAILLYIILDVVGGFSSWWWYAGMAAAVPFEISYVLAILYVAQTRDFS